MKAIDIILICVLALCFTLGLLGQNTNVLPKNAKKTAFDSAQAAAPIQGFAPTEGASMTFDKPQINLGTIKRGDKKEMVFHFTNSGTEDLQIEIVSSCECTTLDWPRSSIKPGEKGAITALFDSTEKEKSETVDIDINLTNLDPKSGYPMFERVCYTFELVQ